MTNMLLIFLAAAGAAVLLFFLLRSRKDVPKAVVPVQEEPQTQVNNGTFPTQPGVNEEQKQLLLRAVEHIYAGQAGRCTDSNDRPEPSAAMQGAMRKILKAFEKIGTLHSSLAALDKPDISLKDVGDMVTRDPILSAMVLKSVNSPVFQTASDVKSIHTAVNILGLVNLKNLIAYGVMPHSLFRKPGHQQMFRRVWLHMNATALTASALAKGVSGVDSGFLYTAGLMHDIGKLVLILLTDGGEDGVYPDTLAQEDELLTATHLDVLKLMTEDGSMPAQLGSLLLNHHTPACTSVSELDCDGSMARAMSLLFVANQIAKLVTAKGTLSEDIDSLDQLDPSFAEILSRDEVRQLLLSPGLVRDILVGVRAAQVMLG